MTTKQTTWFFLVCCGCISPVSAFFPFQNSGRIPPTTSSSSSSSSSSSMGDFDGALIGDAGVSQGGKDLAEEFYQTLRQREDDEMSRIPPEEEFLSEVEKSKLNQEPFAKRRQVSSSSSSSSSSAGLFTGQGQRVYSFPLQGNRVPPSEPFSKASPGVDRSRMVQAALVVALVSLYVAMGLSVGSIADGSAEAERGLVDPAMDLDVLGEAIDLSVMPPEAPEGASEGGSVWL